MGARMINEQQVIWGWVVFHPMAQNLVSRIVPLVFWESMGAQELFPRIVCLDPGIRNNYQALIPTGPLERGWSGPDMFCSVLFCSGISKQFLESADNI